jgi:nucleoside-diphosphate-sugar epimerase
LGYLSSTGVYGDTAGGWVDETAPTGTGRRNVRTEADLAWLALGARVFRLPGIYGPGRSALDRVANGHAHRIDLPDQVFSRVHVDDIVSGVIGGFGAPAGAFNLADDLPCSQNEVIAFASLLLGRDPPPFVALESLSAMARGFYGENRRVANGKAKRLLGWRPAYPDYRAGLRALSAMASPAMASSAPATASPDQR